MQKRLIIKVVLITFIGLLLLIPLIMISEKIWERGQYLQQAKDSVSANWTGWQTLASPVLVLPYITENNLRYKDEKSNLIKVKKVRKLQHKYVLADTLKVTAKINTDIRFKGIYRIPVYRSHLSFNGTFDKVAISKAIAWIKQRDGFSRLEQSFFSTTVSDSRGINSIPVLRWDEQDINFQPGSQLADNNNGIHAVVPSLALSNRSKSTFSFQLELRGMEQLEFIPVASESQVSVSSDWPHPEFVGSFLPVTRDISDDGYQATWKITSFASNIADKLQRCEEGSCGELMRSGFGVKQIETVDVYVQAERSVKYGILFIGLSFIAFFVFEIVNKLPIHGIQYTLVGFAIAIFYLLLVSLSEHLDFALSYLIATCCCVSLLLFYLRFVLGGFKQALIFSAMLALLYAVLFVIISAEDFALLMGAGLTFITLTVVMVCTRHIDWYNLTDKRQLNPNS